MAYSDCTIYFVDDQNEANKIHDMGYGREEIEITLEDIEKLKSGKIMAWTDGEYTHQIKFKEN